MSNNHYYTPNDLNDFFMYMLPKIDFTLEALTTDIGCSIVFPFDLQEGVCDFYEAELDVYKNNEKIFINDILLKTKQRDFKNIYNPHDWVKIYKHAFQHTELVNKYNVEAMLAWHVFSTYFREAVQNDLIGPEKYTLQLKHFMAILAFNQSELEAQCVHQFLHLASKIASNPLTQIDSQKVGNMLGGVFYTALKVEGIHRSFKLSSLDKVQQISYMENVQKISKVLKFIIEDSFFEKEFNRNDYVQFLIVEKPIATPRQENSRIGDFSDEERLPDELFIEKFKLNSSLEVNKELPIDEFRALHISDKRHSRAENFSQDDACLKVSFSDDCLLSSLKRSTPLEEGNCSPKTEMKRKYMSGSSSLGEKLDKLEKKGKGDFEIIGRFNVFTKSDGEKNSELEKKNKNASLFSNSASPDIERRKIGSSKERSLSPDAERRKLRPNKERSLSPDAERRKLGTSKELSLSSDSERKKGRISKELSISPDVERRKLHISKERSLSPDAERRKPRLSKEASLERERSQVIFSRRLSKSEDTSPRIITRIIGEGQKKLPNKPGVLK